MAVQYHSREREVRDYYDRNTRRFLRLARSSAPLAIHQPLYVHKDMLLEDALHTQHRKILELLPQSNTNCTILDLGCGVGESMLYLAKHTSAQYMFQGITLSGYQARIATSRVAEIGFKDRIQVFEGSFQSIPSGIQNVDLAYSIEAFVHADQPTQFFTEVAARLRAQGKLILFDDFLRKEAATNTERKILDDMYTGWLANTLLTPDQVIALASKAGLEMESNTDLSGMLRLYRTRDKFIHFLVPFARPFLSQSQYCRFLVGGDARQQAYRHGLLQYRMLVFEKRRLPFAVRHSPAL